ncbi:MAG TPA: serine/threonine-protein kinase [Sandaracinaceae bacterium LLY-WYZ-13_1]|nr:serine/threonine-protein kinase [Sandaracinaceae bacterium LLY-WYZ-13_1]
MQDPFDAPTARQGRPGNDTWSESTGRSDVHRIDRDGPGQRLGSVVAERYHLVRLLGQGAAGAVYEARDLDRGRAVAIKVLHPHLRASDGHTARFAREIRALGRIAHSAVVRVLDAGEDEDGSLYLVMELLEGELLYDRIMLASLDTRSILEIGRQLLGALAAAHARGIVHRDIKPENLFLTNAPRDAIRLKVLDFGIAKLTQPEAGISFQTLDGLILGTPEYMSPEICRGMPVTAAADLWATAAVLYHAFAGVPPFEDEQVGRLLLRIVRERAPSLATHRPDLPPSLIAALDRALDPDPARRFPDASAFATALASGAPIDDLDWD